jgi:thiosulfate/3-mercaptopyruvate sulfurtransferase
LLDVRSPAEFAGESSRAKRKGHIPGALNQPRSSLVAADHSMKSPTDLQAIFAAQGLDDPNAEIVTYCNAGVSASYAMLALSVAGFDQLALYDGSWKDWGNDESKPIAT